MTLLTASRGGLRFPLNIQTFADPATPAAPETPPAAASGGTPSVQIDYTALADQINQRAQRTTDGALKGLLKDQYGLSGEELDKAATLYKQQLETDKQAKAAELTNAQNRIKELEAERQTALIDKAITDLAQSEGVASEKMPFLLKMIEREGLVGQDGKMAEDKAKSALESVIKAFPDFKGSAGAAGVKPLVGGNGGAGGGSPVDAQLTNIFGNAQK